MLLKSIWNSVRNFSNTTTETVFPSKDDKLNYNEWLTGFTNAEGTFCFYKLKDKEKEQLSVEFFVSMS